MPVIVSGVQYSGSWTLQQQMQAKQAETWPASAGLYSWGNNSGGQLGQNNRVNLSSPVQIGALTTWSNISSGLATKTDGTLWSWGFNSSGELGQNDTINRSSPTQVGALTTWSKIAANAFSLAIKKIGRAHV